MKFNYKLPKCFLHLLFTQKAQELVNQPALVYGGKVYSFEDLNYYSNQVADFLLSTGLKVEATVGLCMDPSPLAVISMLGILKAGCAILALNPDDPVERSLYKLKETKTTIVFVQENYLQKLSKFSGKVLSFTENSFIFIEYSGEDLALEKVLLKPENLAHIIYTSGSTGQPNGVLNEHKNIAFHITSFINNCKIQQNDNIMGFSPLGFDAFIEEIFAVLLAGGQVRFFDKSIQNDLDKIIDFIISEKITILSAPPAILNLLNYSKRFQVKNSSLRLILTGGDTLKKQDIHNLYKDVTIMNGYGLTETTVSSLWHTVTNLDTESIPIGKPLEGKRVYILDENLQPVPAGEIGEIFLAGEGIARGYLNNVEKSAEKFLPDPFLKTPDARMVRTGDLGCFLCDGSVEFHGRVDRQVSIRGFRVELGEIETILCTYDNILDAVVLCKYIGENPYLSAYLKPENEQSEKLNFSGLRNHLKRYLPEHMIPAEYLLVSFIPRTSTGKVDPKKLAQLPAKKLKMFLAEKERGLTDEEIRIRNIWSDLLQIDVSEISVNVHFLELGGDSLLAIKLVAALRHEFKKSISLEAILSKMTIEQQATNILKELREDTKNLPGLVPIAPRDKYLLSSSQQRLWFLNQLDVNKSSYNTISADKLKGKLNFQAFQHAFRLLVRRHPILTVCFEIEEGIPYQRERKDITVNVNLISLENLPSPVQEDETLKLINRELNYKFSLEVDLLFRVFLIKLSEEEFVFLLNVHHIIVDNWSWHILAEELSKLYAICLAGDLVDLPLPIFNYFDYVYWEEKFLTDETIREQKEFWLKKLAGELPVLKLPTQSRLPVLSANGNSLKLVLNQQIRENLKELSKKENISLFIVLLAAFKVLLFRYTGQNDIIVGTPVAHRNISGTEKIPGLFLNPISVRDQVQGENNFGEFLQQVHETFQEAFYHQDYPFEKIVEQINPERDLSHSPIFQVMFDYHGDDSNIFTLKDLQTEPIKIHGKSAKNELTVTVYEENHELVFDFEYNTDLFSNFIITQMSQNYETLLHNLNLQQRLSDLELITNDKKNYLVKEFNKTAKAYPLDKCVHELFQTQVMDTPDQIAYIFNEEKISYHTLNKKANQVARHLQKLGVKSEVIVAICLHKSLNLPVLLLGILKAGGAYLPLDPSFPKDRLMKMLNSSNTALLITAGELSDYFAEFAGTKLLVEEIEESLDSYAKTNLTNLRNPQDLFNIIFTSASTGEPKGVMLTGLSVLNRLYWMWEQYPFQANDIMVNHKSYVLVGAFWEIFGGLLKGISTVILTLDDSRDPARLWNQLRENQVTHLFSSPLILSELLSIAEKTGVEGFALRLAATSAEAATLKLVKQWKKIFPDIPLLNLYGSTEDCSDVTVFDTSNCENYTAGIPIGKPIANTKIYLLDKYLNLVPEGVIGEIYVGGLPLARGYLHDPEKTTAKFIIDQFSTAKEERLYATGDLGYLSPDGNLHLVGRRDHQIKFHGYRIELGDLEAALKQHSDVLNAAVRLWDIE